VPGVSSAAGFFPTCLPLLAVASAFEGFRDTLPSTDVLSRISTSVWYS
jgi:hypothetical protein